MKRAFTDLHLRVNGKNHENTSRMLTKAADLGYSMVAIPLAPETPKEHITQLKTSSQELGLDFATRIDLRPKTPNELLNQLRKFRRKFEVISVQCDNKPVARQAAKDRRVDLLGFPHLDFRHRFFDKAEAELASSSLATLEVDVKPLLVLEGPARIRFLGNLRKEVAVAKGFGLPLVVSSGVSDALLLRKPREVAVLSSLFGLDEVAGLDAVSKNPTEVVARNRGKLGGGFVAPGIRVVKEGKDC